MPVCLLHTMPIRIHPYRKQGLQTWTASQLIRTEFLASGASDNPEWPEPVSVRLIEYNMSMTRGLNMLTKHICWAGECVFHGAVHALESRLLPLFRNGQLHILSKQTSPWTTLGLLATQRIRPWASCRELVAARESRDTPVTWSSLLHMSWHKTGMQGLVETTGESSNLPWQPLMEERLLLKCKLLKTLGERRGEGPEDNGKKRWMSS